MKLNKALFFSAFSVFILLCLVLSAEEDKITITTYYPTPRGVYNEFSTYGNTTFARASGNVGIGTTNLQYKLEVVGGSIKASDGLVIPLLAEDPSADAVEAGQMWVNLTAAEGNP
jgi:hypothetical protein